jgi:hypothetical protein
MVLPVFRRATRSALARLGESAVLRGGPALHKVNIERDVQMSDREGNIFVAQYVGMFDTSDMPAVGNTLDILDTDGVTVVESYVLENRVDTNGYSDRYVLRKV